MQLAAYPAFMQHLAIHGMSYTNLVDFNYRFGLFKKTDDVVRAHNAQKLDTQVKLGHNFSSTWTEVEKNKLFGYTANKPLPYSEG